MLKKPFPLLILLLAGIAPSLALADSDSLSLKSEPSNPKPKSMASFDSLAPKLNILHTLVESDALWQRLMQPENTWLIDGETALKVGQDFYASGRHREGERFLPFRDPYNAIAPPSADTARFQFNGRISQESGDPLLRETLKDSRDRNRTPFTSFGATSHLADIITLRAGLHQNDLLSQGTFSRAVQGLGNHPIADASLIGENAPPLSLWYGSLRIDNKLGGMQISHARGHRMGFSPGSGELYPFETESTRLESGDLGQGIGAYFAHSANTPFATDTTYRASQEVQEIGLRGVGDLGQGFAMTYRWGFRRRNYVQGQIKGDEDPRYPWAMRVGKRYGDENAPWHAGLKVEFEQDEGIFNSTVKTGIDGQKGPFKFLGNGEAYHRTPLLDPSKLTERVAMVPAFVPNKGLLISETISETIPKNARGLRGEVRIIGGDSFSAWELWGGGGSEWEIPVFMENQVGKHQGFTVRSGEYGPNPYALHHVQGGIRFALGIQRLKSFAELGARAWIASERAQAQLTQIPAPWHLALGSEYKPIATLTAEVLVQAYGPREYRGFNADKKLSSSIELQGAIKQSLFKDRLQAGAALFQFPDAEIEHPLGNEPVARFMVFLVARIP